MSPSPVGCSDPRSRDARSPFLHETARPPPDLSLHAGAVPDRRSGPGAWASPFCLRPHRRALPPPPSSIGLHALRIGFGGRFPQQPPSSLVPEALGRRALPRLGTRGKELGQITPGTGRILPRRLNGALLEHPSWFFPKAGAADVRTAYLREESGAGASPLSMALFWTKNGLP